MEKQDKDIYIDGKKVDIKKEFGIEKKVEKQIEEIKQEEERQPYKPDTTLAPLPPPPKLENKGTKKTDLKRLLGRK